jgi:hypothetical protein
MASSDFCCGWRLIVDARSDRVMDERALGIRVCHVVRLEALGEFPLEGRILGGELWIGAEAVSEANALVDPLSASTRCR